jgi:hypothetical protein
MRRARAFDDPEQPREVRDYLLALTLYLVCSRNAIELRGDDWVDRASAIAKHTDVAANRALARIALAWSYEADGDTARSHAWSQLALASEDELPLFHRTLVGTFISRFLARQAPGLAAARLRSIITATDLDSTSIDSIALVTSAGLISGANHPDADDVVATLAATVAPGFLGAVVPDVARHQANGRLLSSDALVERVRAALTDLTITSP